MQTVTVTWPPALIIRLSISRVVSPTRHVWVTVNPLVPFEICLFSAPSSADCEAAFSDRGLSDAVLCELRFGDEASCAGLLEAIPSAKQRKMRGRDEHRLASTGRSFSKLYRYHVRYLS